MTGSTALPARPLDQQEVLSADRFGRDPRGDQLIPGRQVVDRRPAVRPGDDGQGRGHRLGDHGGSTVEDVEDPRGDPRPGDRLAVGALDPDGPRLRLPHDQSVWPRVIRFRGDGGPGPIGQEIDAADEHPP